MVCFFIYMFTSLISLREKLKALVGATFWKTPFQYDERTIYKSSWKDESFYILFSSTYQRYFILDGSMNMLGHILPKLLQWGEKSLNVPLGSLYYPAFDHNEQDSIAVTTAAKLNRKRPIDPPPQPEQEAKISKPSSKAASPAAPAVEPAPSASAAAAPQEFPPRPPGLPADNADVPEPMVPPAPKGKGKGKERHGWMLKCAQLMQAYEDQNWGECNRLINE